MMIHSAKINLSRGGVLIINQIGPWMMLMLTLMMALYCHHHHHYAVVNSMYGTVALTGAVCMAEKRGS